MAGTLPWHGRQGGDPVADGERLRTSVHGAPKVVEHPVTEKRIAPRLLQLPLRPALERKLDRRAGRQQSANYPSALQGPRDESRSENMVQRAPRQGCGERGELSQSGWCLNTENPQDETAND